MPSTRLRHLASPGRALARLVVLALLTGLATFGLQSPTHAADGTISGTVTAVGGTPLSDIHVAVFVLDDDDWYEADFVHTDAQGGYRLTVPHGTYKVGAYDHDEVYERSYYDSAATLDAATVVTVDGAESGVDVALSPRQVGSVIGTVTAEGVPLGGAEVRVYELWPEEGEDYWELVEGTATDDAGAYRLTVPTGTYRVEFEAEDGRYHEFHRDSATLEEAENVVVQAEQATVVDASLEPRPFVTGTVSATEGGAPLAEIGVYLFRQVPYEDQDEDEAEWVWTDSTTTDASGRYELFGDPGTYRIAFYDAERHFGLEYFDDVSSIDEASDVTLAPAGTAGIDATLERTAAIAGTVTGTSGQRLEDVEVAVFEDLGSPGDPEWELVDETYTDEQGTYELPVAAGTYRVGFFGDEAEPSFWDAAPTLAAATDIVVAQGDQRNGIDGVLRQSYSSGLDMISEPTIGGIAKAGSPLRATPGTWSPTPAQYTYSWFVGDEYVPGVTTSTYTPTAGDAGKLVQVMVTAHRPGYASTNAYSEAVGPVTDAVLNLVSPTVTGKPQLGSTLTAAPGSWSHAGAIFGYQWLASGVPVPGATGRTFAPTAAQAGKQMSVRVTATKAGVEGGEATSAPGAAVRAPSKVSVAKRVIGRTVVLTVRVSAAGMRAISGGVLLQRRGMANKRIPVRGGRGTVRLRNQPVGRLTYRLFFGGTSVVLPGRGSTTVTVRR
jgi:5-hydroxyisourate hydrolase-like protein (transthyretin family)